MKPLLTHLIVVLFFIPLTLAQDFNALHFQLEEVTNPNAFLRTGNIRSVDNDTQLQAGTWGSGTFARAIALKTNDESQVVWAFRLNFTLPGSTNAQASYGSDILELDDGGFLLLAALNTNSLSNEESFQNLDYGLIKFRFDESGNSIIEFVRTFGGPYADIPQQIESTPDGGYILAGYSNPEQALNLPSIALTYLVKLDASGQIEWDKRLSTAGECRTDALSLYNQGLTRRTILPTADGGLIYTLQCNDFAYLGKLDQNGNSQWTKSFNNAGLFTQSELNEDWGALLGTGGFGALSSCRELPNGDLAFLGNQTTFFFAILGIALEDPEGFGVALPMSYLLVTDKDGQFKYGSAFFHETFNQENLPLEMMAEDLLPLDNGNYLIACNTSRFFNGNHSYTPALLELNPQATEFDAGIIDIRRIPAESGRHNVQDYPWGLDALHLEGQSSGRNVLLAYDNQCFKLKDWKSIEASDNCLEALPFALHSFPIDIQFSDAVLAENGLNENSLDNISLTSIDLNLMEECAEFMVGTEIPDDTSAPDAKLIMSSGQSGFTLEIQEAWIGADLFISDVSGKLLYTNKLVGTITEIQTANLPSGLYFFILQKENQVKTLKGIVTR